MDIKWLRNSVIGHPLMLVVGIVLVLAIVLSIRAREPNERPISDVIAQAKAGNIEKITDEGETMTLEPRVPQQKARVRKDPNTDVSELLVTGVPPEQIGRIQVEYPQPPGVRYLDQPDRPVLTLPRPGAVPPRDGAPSPRLAEPRAGVTDPPVARRM